MDSQQVWGVKVKLAGSFGGVERFYVKMGRDGRVTIPRLPLELVRDKEQSVVGTALDVDLKPADHALLSMTQEN